jgi:hypothetical protein
VIRDVATESALRQRLMPRASPRVTSMVERKYETGAASIQTSIGSRA